MRGVGDGLGEGVGDGVCARAFSGSLVATNPAAPSVGSNLTNCRRLLEVLSFFAFADLRFTGFSYSRIEVRLG